MQKMLTFNFQVALAGEVVTLPDNASIATTILHLGVLDGQRVHAVLLVVVHGELGALVALLWLGER